MLLTNPGFRSNYKLKLSKVRQDVNDSFTYFGAVTGEFVDRLGGDRA